MATTDSGQKLKRIEIPFFDGVNSLVGANISKKNELRHAENARSVKIGTIEKRQGVRRLGSEITATENYGLFWFENSGNRGFYRISKVSGSTKTYYVDNAGVWVVLVAGGLSDANTSVTFAEGSCFIVNGTDVNRYITSDGTTVVTSSTATGHLYNSPKANKINFYKNRLYVADYYLGANRNKIGIQRSSMPLGIVSLVDGDHASGVTTVNVTDTKYIYASDTLQVYRGDILITTLTVTAKNENAITVNATGVDLLSADELWVNGTRTGAKVFRWVSNAPTGTEVKEYDTFYLTGGQNDRIKMMTNISNKMVIANNNNMGVWDDYSLENIDLDIGCVSDYGFVKNLGALWFIHYSGVYSTTGGVPKLMSAKVQKYIEGATKEGLEASAAGKKGMSVFFTIGDVTLYKDDGSVDKILEDVCLEYNIRQENWFVHTGIDAKIFATYKAIDNPDRLEYASQNGDYEIFELFNTEVQDGEEIPFRIDTDFITLCQKFENYAYTQKIVIETERGSGLQCFISLDDEPFYQIKGEVIKGCTILKVTSKDDETAQPPRCRRIRLSIRDYTAKLCKISRVAIIFVETSEEEEQ